MSKGFLHFSKVVFNIRNILYDGFSGEMPKYQFYWIESKPFVKRKTYEPSISDAINKNAMQSKITP